MKHLDLKKYRIALTIFILIAISTLFSAVLFIVTNSDANIFIPEGQAQIGFENNEFESINFDLTGDSLWTIASDESYTGIYSIKSGNITHEHLYIYIYKPIKSLFVIFPIFSVRRGHIYSS